MAVKTTTDADASQINRTIQDATVEEIIANKSPGLLGKRIAPFERSIWRVKATVESIELKKDGDFYMILRGASGAHTVFEVPDPETCKGSPFEGQIRETRKELEDRFHPTKDKQDIGKNATVTGVGFIGFSNNQIRRGSNGINGARLMPGTSVNFD